MVDASDDQFNEFQKTWVDGLDNHPDPLKMINEGLEGCKYICPYPWNNPRQNMRWLWDYLLMRKVELECLNHQSPVSDP